MKYKYVSLLLKKSTELNILHRVGLHETLYILALGQGKKLGYRPGGGEPIMDVRVYYDHLNGLK